jgi:nucleotide-binding universal stress UspA family protein
MGCIDRTMLRVISSAGAPMKILLPVDGSDYTKRMLAYLAAHGELLPGDHEYTAFTVIKPYSPYDTNFAKAVSMEDFLRDQAEYVLGPVRSFMQKQGWTVQTDYVPGSPVQAIVEKAEVLKPDLIVMGTHGRSPLGTFVLGSVTNGVLGNCCVPVLLIR